MTVVPDSGVSRGDSTIQGMSGRASTSVDQPALRRGTVLLATYNSAGSIEAVLAEIDEAATILARTGFALDILLVDRDSPDDTAEIATAVAEQLGLGLEVLSHAATAASPTTRAAR